MTRRTVAKPAVPTFDVPGYDKLRAVLHAAYQQASVGKGHERHGSEAAFEEQSTQIISGLMGTSDGMYFQAMKKLNESRGMEHEARKRELLGAIVYIAGIYIFEEAHNAAERS
ncbi:hypothetical protein PAER4900a_00059 [Pseudomonas phage YMC17/07/R4900a]|nr:hypothetical protein PAER4900a_00059 [Pseudomonas phage YMC17/07/R4900a]